MAWRLATGVVAFLSVPALGLQASSRNSQWRNTSQGLDSTTTLALEDLLLQQEPIAPMAQHLTGEDQQDLTGAPAAPADDGEARKIAWFHPPKTATSFGATIMHYANASLPKSEGARFLSDWQRFFRKFPQDVWFRDVLWKPAYDHAKVTAAVYNEFRGHFVGLFRQPEQRLLSAFYEKGLGKGDPVLYAKRSAGVVVKELAGQEDGERWACWPGLPAPEIRKRDIVSRCGGRQALVGETPDEPDVGTALARLREGFKFVGLMEQYDLSVCLFHAMFGGECLTVEFANMRPSAGPPTKAPGYTTRMHDVAPLGGYTDPFDGPLYDLAARRFWQLVGLFNVSRSACRALCPAAQGVFDASPDGLALAKLPSAAETARGGAELTWPGRYVLDDMDEILG